MNDTYLKMILALPDEFFKGWEWQAGDRAYSLQHDKELIVVEFDVWHDPRIIHAKYIGEVGYTYLVNTECLRHLPTQEQLQSLCMEIIQCSPQELLRFFEAWLYEDEIRPVIKFENFNDLWLKYAVWVWSRKEWNGSEWV